MQGEPIQSDPLSSSSGMSAIGTKHTSSDVRRESAMRSKADVTSGCRIDGYTDKSQRNWFDQAGPAVACPATFPASFKRKKPRPGGQGASSHSLLRKRLNAKLTQSFKFGVKATPVSELMQFYRHNVIIHLAIMAQLSPHASMSPSAGSRLPREL
jgi:hypothetical protein